MRLKIKGVHVLARITAVRLVDDGCGGVAMGLRVEVRAVQYVRACERGHGGGGCSRVNRQQGLSWVVIRVLYFATPPFAAAVGVCVAPAVWRAVHTPQQAVGLQLPGAGAAVRGAREAGQRSRLLSSHPGLYQPRMCCCGCRPLALSKSCCTPVLSESRC